MKYSLDTSGILDGWRHYPPDIFPPVWERFDELIESWPVDVRNHARKLASVAFQGPATATEMRQ